MFYNLTVQCPEGHDVEAKGYRPEALYDSTKPVTLLCSDCGLFFKAFIRVGFVAELRVSVEAPPEWEPAVVDIPAETEET